MQAKIITLLSLSSTMSSQKPYIGLVTICDYFGKPISIHNIKPNTDKFHPDMKINEGLYPTKTSCQPN